MGIEPTTEAWEAAILPLNYACTAKGIIPQVSVVCKRNFQIAEKLHQGIPLAAS